MQLENRGVCVNIIKENSQGRMYLYQIVGAGTTKTGRSGALVRVATVPLRPHSPL
jgi:hypothetical protein